MDLRDSKSAADTDRAARSGAIAVTGRGRRRAPGAALLDGVSRDLRYACRAFRRAPLAALTIVTTAGLGLGLVAVVRSRKPVERTLPMRR